MIVITIVATTIILPEVRTIACFKSPCMVSHHVTSSRLLVHFAMEQHLLAATPGVLREFHSFVLVNKTKQHEAFERVKNKGKLVHSCERSTIEEEIEFKRFCSMRQLGTWPSWNLCLRRNVPKRSLE